MTHCALCFQPGNTRYEVMLRHYVSVSITVLNNENRIPVGGETAEICEIDGAVHCIFIRGIDVCLTATRDLLAQCMALAIRSII
jgi:hypothetical protein